jgi:hypothetical protein
MRTFRFWRRFDYLSIFEIIFMLLATAELNLQAETYSLLTIMPGDVSTARSQTRIPTVYFESTCNFDDLHRSVFGTPSRNREPWKLPAGMEWGTAFC